jgi:hypothetical protein
MQRLFVVSLLACAATKPGTHVEVVKDGGEVTYVAGAAGPGASRDMACASAVRRSIAAIAQRFAQENEDLGEAVAEELGIADGSALLQRYAKHAAVEGALQDLEFDPSRHLCKGVISWKIPVFLKDALVSYSALLRDTEAQVDSPAKTAPADPCQPKRHNVITASDKAERARTDIEECLRRTGGDATVCHRYRLRADEAAAELESARRGLGACKEATK